MYDEFLKLSENRSVSREGFLVITDCPIARVGARTYIASEIPQVDPMGRETVEVVRTASELFAEETVQSFEGKPICLDHPEPFPVSPENVSEFSVGHMQRVRPDPESGCLIADLFIEDQGAIASVTKGEMTQLSIGYVSLVKDVGGGVGLESRILGNHVAIVKEGRCGAMCSIKDSDSTKTEKQMGIFNPKKDDDKDEVIKALTEENEALKKQLEELKASQQQDSDPNGDKEPKEPQEPTEPKPLTIEDVQKCIDEAFKKRDEEAKQAKAKQDEQKKNDEEVIKDAATVAPKLDSKTPDLAMKALEEFAQSGFGKTFIDSFGGVANIKKDEAPKYLKMAAASVRARAVEDAEAHAKKDAKPQTKSWLEQAADLWK